MGEPATPRVSSNGFLDCQASHLCQECLFVLNMAELDVEKTYPHHSSLKSLLDAYYIKCYLCSSLLKGLSAQEREALQQSAEEKMPGSTDGDYSPSKASHLPSTHKIMDKLRFVWGDDLCEESYGSLTGLRIQSRENIMEIMIRLNLAYNEVLPAGNKLYKAAPTTAKAIWGDRCKSPRFMANPVIINAQGPSELIQLATHKA